ncbi:hypothetical protein FLJC2902T_13260 [Flavobacterium limnosediminis JC2902]|uniref:Uncharacterized protein n=1 Tax=Flavobacterium limnosediminis JC2902 TaxID=1341181 RepID=V6SRC6_9FLAO|nr:hypothetical protein FLJC2902T_13260 [Flavobacterium limnosediminis JC2902]
MQSLLKANCNYIKGLATFKKTCENKGWVFKCFEFPAKIKKQPYRKIFWTK